MTRYQDKKIWIIGASSGIGYSLAHELAQQGAQLALSARRIDKLNELNAELGGQHQVYPLDVTQTRAFVETARLIQDDLTQIDSILFLAGIYTPTALLDMDIYDAQGIIATNLGGALNAIYAVLPILQAQGFGQLALCASVAGYRGLPRGQPYSATKAAMINLAESLRSEHPKLDIKIINPGFVRTPMTDKNTFKMPMMIEPQEAAHCIARSLHSNQFEIHFPKKLTYLMKIVRFLPNPAYFWFIKRGYKRLIR